MQDRHERDVREELSNICQNYPLFPGKTIAHSTARACIDRGWAERNPQGELLPTPLGLRENDKWQAQP